MIPTIPKLVTPNGDGLNDLFIIDGLKDFPTSQLTIFTRSGELVYSSADYKNDWDCKFSGLKFSNNQFVSPGVYYYILNLGGTTQNIKGYVYVSY
jgi:gliding motility-associated-like protein